MKKLSLLVGTLGGALAGYLLSNDKLRDDLVKAKNPEAAAKALSLHLSRDGKKIAKEVKLFAESDEVQKNLRKAKSFATAKFNEAKKGVETMMKKGTSHANKLVKSGTKAVKKKVSGFKDKKV